MLVLPGLADAFSAAAIVALSNSTASAIDAAVFVDVAVDVDVAVAAAAKFVTPAVRSFGCVSIVACVKKIVWIYYLLLSRRLLL